MAVEAKYIHGTDPEEQRRLAALNGLTNPLFLEFLDLRNARTVLEVGSGLGILTREVALRAPNAEIVGVEYSAEQLNHAPREVPNLRFVRGDAHRLDFPDDRFDVVYCRWVLEHVADPVQVLREMRRVARPEGRVFAMENDIGAVRHDPPTPAFDRVWERVADLQEKLGGDARIGSKLHRLARAAGLREIEVSLAPEAHRFGSPGFAVWIEDLAHILAASKGPLAEHALATPEEVDAGVGALRRLLEIPDASTYFYWNRIRAHK